MRYKKTITSLLFIFGCLSMQVNSALAQPKASDNLIHTRHSHHNPKHPTQAPSQQRFFTTRTSDVQLPLPNEEDAFVFTVFGDRTGGPAAGVNVLADAVRDVNLLEPDLVMTVGDLINGYNQTPKWMEQMHEFKGIMNELICPWFPVAGNHDVYWRPLTDPEMPLTQHDDHYEMHFGPLWYSFQHKNCNFIVLYSDEGDPETGEKNFHKPECQKISDAQLKFLQESLMRGKKNDHQFIFLHHPRWLGGGYGTEWKTKVHPLLLETGNVTAVFAGHIHYMRSDPLDGIEYITLATVGGSQSGALPGAGFLHQYHVVTVRPKQVAMAAFPVGEAINVREITSELQSQISQLAAHPCNISQKIRIEDRRPQHAELEIEVSNPADRPIDFTLTPQSQDSNWSFSSSHSHGRLEPGETEIFPLSVDYRGGAIDETFAGVNIVLAQDYLAPTTRYPVPDSVTPVEFLVEMNASDEQLPNRALSLDGVDDAVEVASNSLKLPQGPFTVEAWFKPESFGSRVGLLAKTQSSEFSIFLSKGIPSASLHLGERYQSVRSTAAVTTNSWHHVAFVYNGSSVALFVDGEEIERLPVDSEMIRTVNRLPFFIGADPGGDGSPGSFYHGLIDEVRVTSAPVYSSSFEPQRRLPKTDETVVLFNFDDSLGPIQYDSGPHGSHSYAVGGAKLVDVAAE